MGTEVIWKYQIPTEGPSRTFTIDPPEYAHFLHVDRQDDAVCMWWRVDPSFPVAPRRLQLIGTGEAYPEGWAYLGTFQDPPHVWHLFEVVGEAAP